MNKIIINKSNIHTLDNYDKNNNHEFIDLYDIFLEKKLLEENLVVTPKTIGLINLNHTLSNPTKYKTILSPENRKIEYYLASKYIEEYLLLII